MNAAIYIRVSTDTQELSPAAQEEQARLFCRMKAIDVAAVFHEIGVSGGRAFATRPKGGELLARLMEFDVIVLTKLDRAFRSTIDCLQTVDRLRAAERAIVFLDLNIDSSTPAGMLCLTMMSAFATFERQRTGERITEALAVVKSQGRKIGPAAYGFSNRARVVDGRKVDAGLHASIDAEAATIERIREMRRTMSLREIALELQHANVPTRRGGQWSAEIVRRILARSEA